MRSSPLPRPASAVTSPGVSSGRLWTPLAASHASAVGLELQLQSPATDTREPPSVLVQGAVADAVFSPLEATPPFRPHESTAAAPAAPPGTPQGGPERPTSTLVALAPPGAMPAAAAAAASPARRSDAPDPSPSDSVIANVASVGVLTASGVATEESSSAQVSGTEGSASATSSQNEGAAGGSLVGHGAETAVVPGTAGSPERAFPAQRGGTAHLAHVGTRENLLSRISSPALQFWRSAAPWRRVTPRLPPPPLGLNADLQSEAEAGSQSERASSDDGGAGDIPQAAAGVPSGLRRPVAEHLHAAASAVSTPAASMASAAPPGSVGGADASPSTAGAVASSASGGASRSTSDAAGTASSARTDDRATGNVSDSTASGSPAHAPVGHHHPRHHHGRSHGGAHHHHHHEERGGSLTRSELSLLEGTLGLMSCSVASRMVPLDRVFALAETAPVDADLLRRVADTAHSRLPVLAGDGSDRHAIVGSSTEGRGFVTQCRDIRFSHIAPPSTFCRSVARQSAVAPPRRVASAAAARGCCPSVCRRHCPRRTRWALFCSGPPSGGSSIAGRRPASPAALRAPPAHDHARRAAHISGTHITHARIVRLHPPPFLATVRALSHGRRDASRGRGPYGAQPRG